MATYRVAVIGLTGIGAAVHQPAPDPVLGVAMPHSHVAAYAALPRTELVAVCDLVPALIEQTKREWASDLPDLHGYTDYRQMLAEERIDLLSVVTPDHRHAQIVEDAIAAGVKGIFCEKPIATTLADADRIIGACARGNVPLLIDHTRRWYADYLEARRLIRSGAIGPVSRIVATLGGPRAMLFRNATHLVDEICLFAESEPDWVIGVLDDEQAGYPPRYAGDGGRDPATDPGLSGIIHFENGVRGLINGSKGTMTNFEFDVAGERGRIQIGTHVSEIWRLVDGDQPAVSQIKPPPPTRGDMLAAIDELIGLVENGGAGSSNGQDGRRVLSILLGLLQSNAAGGARVTFPIQDA
jgi:predicted dehydrogenase